MYSAVEVEDRSITERYLIWWTYLENGRFLASRCILESLKIKGTASQDFEILVFSKFAI